MADEPRILGNRYQVGKLIGRGGMGEVFLGTDTRLGRTVAIKVMRSQYADDEAYRARFRMEARSAARMNHPNIVRTYDTGQDFAVDANGNPVVLAYIIMEYVEGKTVKDLIRSGALTIQDSVRIITDVLSALEYAHRAGIVHRDIKPGNVMLSVSGTVKVMDFGVAKVTTNTSSTVAMSGGILGTATYFAPEQARGETADARSDLYSTGVMLYEMLTGKPPFTGDSPTSIAYQHVNRQPEPPEYINPMVTPALSRVILTALAKSPNARYRTARDFSEDLASAMAGQGTPHAEEVMIAVATSAAPTSSSEQDFNTLGFNTLEPSPATTATPVVATKSHRLSWLWISAGVLGLLTIAALIWFILFQPQGGLTAYQVTVPDVTGYSSEDATATLQDAGLAVTTTERTDDTVPADQVISIEPSAGTNVLKGATVTVTVSTGKEQVQVPSVANMTLSVATARLQSVGLTVGQVTSQDSGTVAKDLVLSTNPAANQSVDKGSTVDIVLSTGQVSVPDVTGKTLSDAQTALTALGFTVKVEAVYVCSGTADQVVSQSPTAGAASQGATVTLKYNLVDSSFCSTRSQRSSPSASSSTSQ